MDSPGGGLFYHFGCGAASLWDLIFGDPGCSAGWSWQMVLPCRCPRRPGLSPFSPSQRFLCPSTLIADGAIWALVWLPSGIPGASLISPNTAEHSGAEWGVLFKFSSKLFPLIQLWVGCQASVLPVAGNLMWKTSPPSSTGPWLPNRNA